MFEKIKETADFLSARMPELPEIGMIAGTGLGSVAGKMQIVFRMEFENIPNFPVSTTKGHDGALVYGKLSGRTVVALEGRFHLYEGYAPADVAFPVRVMALLGVKYLFISSAAGGLNIHFKKGELMIVTDHVNLTGTNPLVGANNEIFGPRFPDMTDAYSRDLVSLAEKIALESGIMLRKGVYAGILGPSLETPAETRFLKIIGADAVGMSTVTEVIAGVHCGMKILAIVAITNMNFPDCMEKTTIDEVIATAHKISPVLSALWERIAADIPA